VMESDFTWKGTRLRDMPRAAARSPLIVLALPRGEAARALGVSEGYFDRLVAAGAVPAGRILSDGATTGKTVWLVDDLRAALEDLPSDDGKRLDHRREARPF
jgi:hypothetical protein